MATKEDKDNQKSFVTSNSSNNIQFTNLNLNDHYKASNDTFVQRETKSNNDKQFDNFVIDNQEKRENLKLWNNASNNLCLESFIGEDEKKKKSHKRWISDKNNSNTTTTSSTLSLHIAAYENGIEAASNETKKEEKLTKQSKLAKALISTAKIQDPFEIPRQMQDDDSSSTPEIMQFRASQRMLSPNQAATPPATSDNPSSIMASTPDTSTQFQEKFIEDEDVTTAIADKSIFYNSIEHGAEVLSEVLNMLGFNTLEDAMQYFSDPLSINFDHVTDRNVELLLICEHETMARDVAKILSNNHFINAKQEYYQNEQRVFENLYKFEMDFYGRKANVTTISTAGPLCDSSHVDKTSIKGYLLSPSYYSKLQRTVKKDRCHFPLLLSNNIKDCDGVILWIDNDDQGELTCFDIIRMIKEELHIPTEKHLLDLFYRAKFSCSLDAPLAIQKLQKFDVGTVLSMIAKSFVDKKTGVSFSNRQSFDVNHCCTSANLKKLLFGPVCSMILHLAVKKHLIAWTHPTKYFIEFEALIDGIHYNFASHYFADKKIVDELFLKLSEHNTFKVVKKEVELIQVEAPEGLTYTECLTTMSKFLKMTLPAITKSLQLLYANGFITYYNTNVKAYPNPFNFNIFEFATNLTKICKDIVFDTSKLQLIPGITVELKSAPLMPTGKVPDGRISTDAYKCFTFICRRFLASFLKPYKYSLITYSLEIGNGLIEYSCSKDEEIGFTEILPEHKYEGAKEKIELSKKLITGKEYSLKFDVKSCKVDSYLKDYEMVQLMECCSLGTEFSLVRYIREIEKQKYIQIDRKTGEIRPTQLGYLMNKAYETIIPQFGKYDERAKFITEIQSIASDPTKFVDAYNRLLMKSYKTFKKFNNEFYFFVEKNIDAFCEIFSSPAEEEQ